MPPRIKVHGLDELITSLKRVGDHLGSFIKDVIDQNSILLATRIKTKHLSGPTSNTSVSVRSGRLRASTRPVLARVSARRVKGGVTIGTAYAPVHFGPKGSETTITPKPGKQYLTIPLDAAKTKAGVVRGRARDEGVWGKTFVRKSKAGNLIVFGQKRGQRGAGAGKLSGNIQPLFVLKKSVTIKARVHPEELVAWIRKKITAMLERRIGQYVRRNKA
jgi:hypothetical protein